ncbi:IS5 family transposase [Chelativorans sp. YIM 93263]|uniref:IS5 family transposase n=1 Tax=Chelativorans sp. YIM 93263 TaxID=2906648 RepID=UPI0023782F04|nr:IS5 family transposase [Chelativorans sp. YIM 93263]
MSGSRYASNVTDEQWSIVEPLLPKPKRRGRRRRISLRSVIDAIFYLLRTGCQWRQLPREFPVWSTVYWYFRKWQRAGIWVRLQRELYRLTRIRSGRPECPTVVIMDGQSVKTTEVGGTRGFDAFKRVKGRKRHILVDTLGLPIANRVEAANVSDRRAGGLLTSGLKAIFPAITTIIADAGHESKKLARALAERQSWRLEIVKRRQRAFEITGLTWIVERSFAWIGRNRRLSKDYEYRIQTSETMIDIASTRLMLNRLAKA